MEFDVTLVIVALHFPKWSSSKLHKARILSGTTRHDCSCANMHGRAVRRRTGGRRRRWVVLGPAAAARRAFFIGGGGGVALWSAASAASDQMREH